MNKLFRLVYCSRNLIDGPRESVAAELDRIMAISRANNARDEVTGAMLYTDRSFAQILEGGLDQVQETFERIQLDLRHDDVVVLQAAPASSKIFGAWNMALVNTTNDAVTYAVLDQAFERQDAEAAASVLSLLKGLVHRNAEWAFAAE